MARFLKYKVAYKFGNGIEIKDVKELHVNEFGVKGVVAGNDGEETVKLQIDSFNSHLLEFTGAFDSKGFGIYSDMVIDDTSTFKRYVIGFADGCFYAFNIANPEDMRTLNHEFVRSVEVVGNVHQNPEFTEPTQEDFNRAFNLNKDEKADTIQE